MAEKASVRFVGALYALGIVLVFWWLSPGRSGPVLLWEQDGAPPAYYNILVHDEGGGAWEQFDGAAACQAGTCRHQLWRAPTGKFSMSVSACNAAGQCSEWSPLSVPDHIEHAPVNAQLPKWLRLRWRGRHQRPAGLLALGGLRSPRAAILPDPH